MHRLSRLSVVTLLGAAFLLTGAGCTDSPPPAAEPAAPPPAETEAIPAVFSFTNTTEEVAVAVERARPSGESVSADFNLDGLRDIAVVERTEDGGSSVRILIRKSDMGGVVEDGKRAVYYAGGSIRLDADMHITGLASTYRKPYTDLLILVSGPGGSSNMRHYRNDGTGFEEVTEEADAPTRDVPPAPPIAP